MSNHQQPFFPRRVRRVRRFDRRYQRRVLRSGIGIQPGGRGRRGWRPGRWTTRVSRRPPFWLVS